MKTQQKTIEVVVQAEDDGASLLFDHAGNIHVADDANALGRWVLELAANESTPSVEFGKPSGRFLELASRLMDQQGIPRAATADATAVHIVVQVRLELEEDAAPGLESAVVHPQRGRVRLARSVEELGKLCDELARDDGQPKVPGGAPPDAFSELLSRGATCIGEVL